LGPQKSLQITFVSVRSKVWIGISDLIKIKQTATNVFTTSVQMVVRHPETYSGSGAYGEYGGYDITLVQLTMEVPSRFGVPACLPLPQLQDVGVKANIAGYGSYYRKSAEGQKCLTDEYGKNKFHMCAEMGRGETICKDRAPPESDACATFFTKKLTEFPDEYEEIQLVDNNGHSEYCYPSASPRPGSQAKFKIPCVTIYSLNEVACLFLNRYGNHRDKTS
jgi:hypothetical protein